MAALSGVMMMGCISPPILVAPGEILSDSMPVVAGQPGTITYPQFTDRPVEGNYRLAVAGAFWDFAADVGHGVLLPERLRLSNGFSIRVE